MVESTERAASWSRYWAGKPAHSCPGSFSGNYDGEFSTFWAGCAADMHYGSRVLDLGTGNGALPKLLASLVPATREIEIHGVDLAEIVPDAQQGSGAHRLHYHAGVQAESLPFPDGMLSHVVSQYGFEYMQTGEVIAEIDRVCAPASRVAFVMHHAHSIIARNARSESLHCAWLLADGGLLDLTERLTPYMVQAAMPGGAEALAGDAGANALRKRYNGAQAVLATKVDTEECTDVLADCARFANDVLVAAPAIGLAGALAATRKQRTNLADMKLRVDELLAHALEENGITELDELFSVRGYRCDWSELRYSGQLMGWAFKAQRS